MSLELDGALSGFMMMYLETDVLQDDDPHNPPTSSDGYCVCPLNARSHNVQLTQGEGGYTL
eukprot:m.83301 g.83301  ORF g.83301 m.83301 type:complete len:61 (-) comp9528_c0_seq1:39-221(-)